MTALKRTHNVVNWYPGKSVNNLFVFLTSCIMSQWVVINYPSGLTKTLEYDILGVFSDRSFYRALHLKEVNID